MVPLIILSERGFSSTAFFFLFVYNHLSASLLIYSLYSSSFGLLLEVVVQSYGPTSLGARMWGGMQYSDGCAPSNQNCSFSHVKIYVVCICGSWERDRVRP